MKTLQNEPLASYTSLKAGGAAENLVILEHSDSLHDAVAKHKYNGPVWILGYGTNCLISDKGLPGTVILNRTGKLERLGDNRFKAESGVDWDDLVREVIASNLWGIEFTSGIPGGVGAAITGNIAAYGHKVADVFVEATILNSANNSIETWKPEQLEFDYRASALQKPENRSLIVLDATFDFSSEPTGKLEYQSAIKAAVELGLKPDSLENRRHIIMETRRRAGSLLSNSKTGPWTAGSFFKNPVVNEDQIEAIIAHEEAGISREQLIRQSRVHTGSGTRVSAAHVLLAAGFHRGQEWGNVRLHPDHILKVENKGHATAQEMHDVVQQVIKTVRDKLDIVLEPEVRFLGEF